VSATGLPAVEQNTGIDSEPVAQYYGAASNSLVGSAALVDRDGSLALFVDVRAVD
jgi:hypothetical protein